MARCVVNVGQSFVNFNAEASVLALLRKKLLVEIEYDNVMSFVRCLGYYSAMSM